MANNNQAGPSQPREPIQVVLLNQARAAAWDDPFLPAFKTLARMLQQQEAEQLEAKEKQIMADEKQAADIQAADMQLRRSTRKRKSAPVSPDVSLVGDSDVSLVAKVEEDDAVEDDEEEMDENDEEEMDEDIEDDEEETDEGWVHDEQTDNEQTTEGEEKDEEEMENEEGFDVDGEQQTQEAQEAQEKQAQEEAYEQATLFADYMMEDRTDADVEDFLKSVNDNCTKYREWSQEDWDEWNSWGSSWVTDREWAWYVYYKDFLEARGLFC